MTPQCKAMLWHLKNRGPLTSLEALHKLGIGRAAARALDLKDAGYPIKRRLVWVKKRGQEKARVASYSFGA